MNINANVGNVGNSATLVHVLRARFGSGRIVLPTSDSRVYTHLKHIQGVPSSIEGQGYSINRMRAIDSMIARLASDDAPQTNAGGALPAIDTLAAIGKLLREEAGGGSPYLPRSIETTGLLIDQLA